VTGLTILYYTSNRISDHFANNVRNHLLETTRGRVPIISISHKPIDFGKNICVEGLTPSIYNVYKQILIGAKKAETRFVACCEDDTLYVPEHFQFIPFSEDIFYYNTHRWNIRGRTFFFRTQRKHPTGGGMCMCIASTELMIKTLEGRFEKFPAQPENLIGFMEPGRYDYKMGFEQPKSDGFYTQIPTLTFVHRPSLGGVRQVSRGDEVKSELPYWGKASELWERIYNGSTGTVC